MTGRFAQPDAVLKVKKQAAIVQIDGANGSKTVVYHKVFGVDKAGGILINLYSRIQQRGIVGSGHLKNVAFVRDMGRDDFYVYP